MKTDLTEFEEEFDLPVGKWRAREKKIQKRVKLKDIEVDFEKQKKNKEKSLTKPAE